MYPYDARESQRNAQPVIFSRTILKRYRIYCSSLLMLGLLLVQFVSCVFPERLNYGSR